MNTPELHDHDQTEALRARLAEAEEILRAIRKGEIDALVVEGVNGDRVYTLQSAEEPYRTLVEEMQEGAVVFNASGEILFSNARFAALMREPLELMIGTRIDRFVCTSNREAFQELLLAGQGRRRMTFVRSDSGTLEVSVSLTTTASPPADRLNLIVMDLTELFAATRGRDRAERDSRTKDEFLATLAHELRTPLSAISNAVSVLELTHVGQERGRHPVDVIARQVSHISHLIKDLLDVERVVSGKIQLNRRPLDLAQLVKRAVSSFTDDAGLDRQIDITTEPVWVDGDAIRLAQVLTNITANAVKYTTPGSRIRVVLRADDGDAVLSVEDTGYGISAALLPSIFDMYVQADRTLDSSRDGLGIGLTLVRRLVELHGGTVVASSEGEGRGSRFVVRLKQVPAAEDARKAPRATDAPVPKRVLLIEDNEDARDMLRMVLELAGHIVYDAPDGDRGLELLETAHPDVGIIDISLPGIDGYEVAKRIREADAGRSMLLLALTGYDAPGDADRSIAHGFDHHLVKPIDPAQLTSLLNARVLRSPGLPA